MIPCLVPLARSVAEHAHQVRVELGEHLLVVHVLEGSGAVLPRQGCDRLGTGGVLLCEGGEVVDLVGVRGRGRVGVEVRGRVRVRMAVRS